VLQKDAKVELLRRAPLFARCSARQLRAIAAVADEIEVPAGKALTRQDEAGREFFVLIEGSADVTRNSRKVNTLRSGDFFGEIALVRRAPRTATVTASTPVRALVLTAPAFRKVLRDMPALQLTVLEALAERVSVDV
jgi:CRP/FNR family transcriptional regulator, cyclic AMP receptor protein